MMVQIAFSEKKVEAELYDSDPTIKKLVEELPFGNRAHVAEGEMYVSLPVVGVPGKETFEVHPGDICYWEEANALLFVLGRTKLSTDENPKLPDAVTVIGKITGDMNQLKAVEHRDKVVVEIK